MNEEKKEENSQLPWLQSFGSDSDENSTRGYRSPKVAVTTINSFHGFSGVEC